MTLRNLNPYPMFEQVTRNNVPQMRFAGSTRAEFEAWSRQLKPLVLQTLGKRPEKVALNPQLLATWEADGLIKERWVLDVQPGYSATVLVFRPASLKQGEKRPAILCNHGHGGSKDFVMGTKSDAKDQANIRVFNYDYGLQLAMLGFVTYAIDWMGFGERNPKQWPNVTDAIGSERDPCNVYYLCATMIGTTPLMMNLHDAMRATDFVIEQPYVDGTRLGVVGLSLGGTMTTWTPLIDERFSCANISCYSGPFHEIAYRTNNVCGLQVTPGILDLCDVADLQGLHAPKPVLIEVGLQDECFHGDHSLENLKQVERIYAAAGASNVFEGDVFPGGHRWSGAKSNAFFRRHLHADW
jgi:dienelactone hydrolase